MKLLVPFVSQTLVAQEMPTIKPKDAMNIAKYKPMSVGLAT